MVVLSFFHSFLSKLAPSKCSTVHHTGVYCVCTCSYTTEIVFLPFSIFFADSSKNKSFLYSIMPTFLHKSSLFTVSSKPASNNMSNAVLSGDEEEQCLFTQPEADDLMVDLDSPKRKGTTQMNKQASKKKQHPDMTDANLDA